jgi:hypothetical protein
MIRQRKLPQPQQPSVSEAEAFAALNDEQYMDRVAGVHEEAENITYQAAQQRALELARAEVASIPVPQEPETPPQVLDVPSAPTLASPALPTADNRVEPSQAVAPVRRGIRGQIGQLAHDVKGLTYDGRHAKPKGGKHQAQ